MKPSEQIRILSAAIIMARQLDLDRQVGIEWSTRHAMGVIGGNYVLVDIVLDAMGFPEQVDDCGENDYCRDYILEKFEEFATSSEDTHTSAASFLDWLESDLRELRIDEPKSFAE